MEKINYRLTLLSSLIISPRSNLALYRELGEFSTEWISDSVYLKKDKLRVIYPFYQYGEYGKYEEYVSGNGAYYLPGSSIKGALCQKDLMVDDVTVPAEAIVLRNLQKVQYLKEEKKACQEPFLDHVGVEMVKKGVVLNGECYIDNLEKFKELIGKANRTAKKRIGRMRKRLLRLEQKAYSDKLCGVFHEVAEKLECVAENDNVFLLGGYKGLFHSMEVETDLPETEGAVFLDPETMLTHGLVKIEII